ncbi:MAG: NUDIX domain-containing protein, partial [Chromatocurvus sp.]
MTTDSASPTAPPTPEPAATLILLRSAGAGTEVLMQVRHSDIAFAGGALVFPGGKLEPQDDDAALGDVMDDTGSSDGLRAARVAAIRETFEECGLMLAHEPGSRALAGGDRIRRLCAARQRLHRGEEHFVELLRRESLQLACSALVHFAHWVTPEFMPRRFDTHFFLAQAPTSQEDAHDGRESVESVWIRPEDAISAAANGRYRMLFPTRSILHRLYGAHTPADHLR